MGGWGGGLPFGRPLPKPGLGGPRRGGESGSDGPDSGEESRAAVAPLMYVGALAGRGGQMLTSGLVPRSEVTNSGRGADSTLAGAGAG